MMEIHGTIHFKLILPHFPGFQQEPLPAPVCSRSPECDGCPYTVFHRKGCIPGAVPLGETPEPHGAE